jgi:hypothetical protein
VAQLMRTSNPALSDQAFQGEHAAFGETMTLQGTANKTGILLVCAIATAAWTWNIFLHSHSPEAVYPLGILGVIGGLIGGDGHDLQKVVGSGDRAYLRAPGRPGSGNGVLYF